MIVFFISTTSVVPKILQFTRYFYRKCRKAPSSDLRSNITKKPTISRLELEPASLYEQGREK